MGPNRFLVMAALACSATAACAGLGASAVPLPGGSTVAMVSPAGATYQVTSSQLESGTTVRQYADAGGVVFAVAWSGPFLPDLRELLGSHFADLRQVELGEGNRSSAVSISRPDFMLVSAGHMGAFQGRAWLPAQLPAGFDPRMIS